MFDHVLVLLGSTLGADPYDPPVVTKKSLVLFRWHAVFERNFAYSVQWDCLAKDVEPDLWLIELVTHLHAYHVIDVHFP